jgi:hypothetical protein
MVVSVGAFVLGGFGAAFVVFVIERARERFAR